MKNEKLTNAVTLFFLILTIFVFCRKQKTEWSGTIEEVNGIMVIKNSVEPMFGIIEFELDEDLSIGNESDKNYQFFRAKDVDLDNQGNIFVADLSNFRIQKFDSNGKYLYTFGRQGQGPGEFEHPSKVLIDEISGNVCVIDMSRNIEIFSAQGNFLKSITLMQTISDIESTEDNNFIAVLNRATDEELLYYAEQLCKIDLDGKITTLSAEFPNTIYTKQLEKSKLYISTGYELSLNLARIDRDTLVYSYSKDYELNVINNNGQLLFRIIKDEPRPEFTSEEKNIPLFKKIPLPDYKPYFFSILCDSEGRIYVQRNLASETIRGIGSIETKDKEVDVFSKNGHFLFKTTLPPNTFVIKDGHIYSYWLDENTANEYIKRYKIKNWEQIKTGI